jgi:C4-type Zn-finger protein
MSCPKCSTEESQGFIEPNIVFTTDGAIREIRCVNCGWRPRDTRPIASINKRKQRKWTFKKPLELKAA